MATILDDIVVRKLQEIEGGRRSIPEAELELFGARPACRLFAILPDDCVPPECGLSRK